MVHGVTGYIYYTYYNTGVVFVFFESIVQPNKFLMLAYNGEVWFAEFR